MAILVRSIFCTRVYRTVFIHFTADFENYESFDHREWYSVRTARILRGWPEMKVGHSGQKSGDEAPIWGFRSNFSNRKEVGQSCPMPLPHPLKQTHSGN